MGELKTSESRRKLNNEWRAEHKQYFRAYQKEYQSDPIIALSRKIKETVRRYFLTPFLKGEEIRDPHKVLYIYEITKANPEYLKEFLIANYKAKYNADPILDNYAGIKIYLVQNVSTGSATTDKEVRDLYHYTNLRLVRKEDKMLKMTQDRALIRNIHD